MGKSKRKRRGKGRIALVAVLVLVGGGVLAWFLVERYVINVDRYRADVVAAIEDATGLPASIRKLELDLMPSPRLQAHDVVVGDETFRVAIGTVTAAVQLSPLLQRKVEISSVTIAGLEVRVPSDLDDLIGRINALIDAVSQPSDSELPFEVSIASIRADAATLFLDDENEASATLAFEINDAVSDSISFAFSADSTKLGAPATMEASLRIELSDGEVDSIAGTGTLSGVDFTRTSIEGAPEGIFSARVVLAGRDLDAIDFELNGAFDSDEYEALSGTLISSATWSEEGLTVREAVWESPGIEVHAEATVDKEGVANLRIITAHADQSALDKLVDMVAFEGITTQTEPGAAFAASDVVVHIPAEGAPQLEQGLFILHGFRFTDDEGAVLAAGLQGRLSAKDGLIRIEELRSDAFSLKGTLRPNFDAESVVVNLEGSAQFRKTHVAAFLDIDAIQEVEGSLTLTSLTGTFTRDGGIPEDLVIEGKLEGGLLELQSDDYSVRLTSITSTFHTDSDGIRTTLRAASADIGPIVVEGAYRYADRTWAGFVTTDLPKVITAFMPSDSDLRLFDSVLEQYNDSTMRADLRFAGPDRERTDIHLVREGTPTLEVRAAFETTDSGERALGAITANAVVVVDGLDDEAFQGAVPSGKAHLTLTRNPATKRFEFVADFTEVSVKYGSRIEKRAGDLLRVVVTGDAGDTWSVEETRVDLLEEHFPITINEDGSAEGRYTVDAAHLAALLPEGSTVHGTITGDFKTEPFSARAIIKDVGFVIDEKLRIDSISGAMEFREEDITVRDLHVVGGKSDYTLVATRRSGRWDGSLRGAALDLDMLMSLYEGATDFVSNEEEGRPAQAAPAPDEGSMWDDPLLGTFSVQLDKLYYRRAEIDKFAAKIVAVEDAIHIQDIYLRPHSGTLRGTIDIVRAAGMEALVTARFEAKEIDFHIVDELIYEASQDVSGLISATVNFSAPLGDYESMLAAGSGTAEWSGINGSLGKLGFATKILSTLRTVELFSLKVPSLRDKGLAYTTFGGRIDMKDGVMRLVDVQLLDTAYGMDADGQIDFAREKTDVNVHVHMMEGVTRIVERIPILGQITKLSTDLVGVSIHVRGSPYDVQTIVIPGGDNILGNAGELGTGIIKDVADTILKLIPRRRNP